MHCRARGCPRFTGIGESVHGGSSVPLEVIDLYSVLYSGAPLSRTPLSDSLSFIELSSIEGLFCMCVYVPTVSFN